MSAAVRKRIFVIAGPNGAGKSTFAHEFLPNEAKCLNFVNADLIAAGLAPFQPEAVALKAGRLMLAEIHEYCRKKQDFALETTLSGRHYARLIPQWQAMGYHVNLLFFKLKMPELAVARVRQRVKCGGHNIPEPVIHRRFAAGLKNVEKIYKPLANEWAVYDNSGPAPALLEESHHSEYGAVEDHPETSRDLADVEAALIRAAERAREIAHNASVPVMTINNGVITKEQACHAHPKN